MDYAGVMICLWGCIFVGKLDIDVVRNRAGFPPKPNVGIEPNTPNESILQVCDRERQRSLFALSLPLLGVNYSSSALFFFLLCFDSASCFLFFFHTALPLLFPRAPSCPPPSLSLQTGKQTAALSPWLVSCGASSLGSEYSLTNTRAHKHAHTYTRSHTRIHIWTLLGEYANKWPVMTWHHTYHTYWSALIRPALPHGYELNSISDICNMGLSVTEQFSRIFK